MRLTKSSSKPSSLKLHWPLMVRRIQGHSMMPVLPPGTVVVGLRWFRKLMPGTVIVFFHDGKEKIKRVVQIDDDRLYVLGDHGSASTDSRQYGWIDQSQVLAKVIWPETKKVESALS